MTDSVPTVIDLLTRTDFLVGGFLGMLINGGTGDANRGPVVGGGSTPVDIADFALVDPEGTGNRKLVLLVVQTNLLGMAKGRSSVVVLDLRPPG